jgi:acyl dehydratase
MPTAAEYLSPSVTRLDIAATCVATDDPAPVHLDERFAVEEAGYPSVLAPGTMLLGWAGEYLEQLAGGPVGVRSWTVRFTSPVWPGDRVRLATKSVKMPDNSGGQGGIFEIVATTDAGVVVGEIHAELAVTPDGGGSATPEAPG